MTESTGAARALAEVRPLRPGVADVAAVVLDGLDDLVPTMVAAYRREVAEYAAMDADDLLRVGRTSAGFLGAFLRDLCDGVAHPRPDHPRLVAAGRSRQEGGISLDAAMHAFRLASREGWSAIAAAAEGVGPEVVADLAGRWIEYSDHASTAFAEGHQRGAQESLRRLDARRQALLADLLEADTPRAARSVARAHGLSLAERYVPVLLAPRDPHDVELPPLPGAAVGGVHGGRPLVLLPDDGGALRDVVGGDLARRGTVVTGDAATPGPELNGEVARTSALLDVALRTGRTGHVDPSELLLHRAVAEHEDLAAALRREVLTPLRDVDPDGVLLGTVRAYVAVGGARAVADELFVHVNTVAHRLRRVREATGLDARVPSHAARLVLALALLDIDHDNDHDREPS